MEGIAIPENTRVHRCVEDVTRKQGSATKPVNAYAACQASTHQGFQSGKPIKRIKALRAKYKALSAQEKAAEKFRVGQKVRFNGKAADGSVEGSFDVVIVDPHSNADDVAKVERGREYDRNGRTHLATATVERPETMFMGKPRPAKRFEAYHHTLRG